MKRKIAAILAADIVGYSRLVGEDEEDTLRRLESYRAVFHDFVARFGGRIFNTAGDAILAEFASAVDAVRCAIDIQESIRTRNLAYPLSRHISFRIGITIGDIVEREGDLLGEGVNIASRLEGIAPPGGICISRSVHEAVFNKISLKFSDVGQQQLKNIADPIHAYTVNLEHASSHAWLRPAGLKRSLKWGTLGAAALALFVGWLLLSEVAVQEGGVQKQPESGVAIPLAGQSGIRTAEHTVTQPAPPEASDTTAEEGQREELAQEETAVAPHKAPFRSDRPLAGQWQGGLTENDGDQYDVEISIEPDGSGTIRYPMLKCTGTLAYLTRRGETYVYKETITSGRVCGNTAQVELTLSSSDGSTVDYNWVGRGPKVTGQLQGTMNTGAQDKECTRYLPSTNAMILVPCD